MGYSIGYTQTKKKGTVAIIHTSFRRNGKVTSARCGAIENIEKLKIEKGTSFERYLKETADQIYSNWEKSLKITHTFVHREGEECTNAEVIYTSQMYLRNVFNAIGLDETLRDLKSLSKGKWKFDLAEVVFFLISKQIIDPKSKLDAFLKADEYLIKPNGLTIDSLYDSLDVLADHLDLINTKTYKKACKYLDKKSNLYFYDVTSINLSKYVKESEIVGFKKGKEGIFGPLVQIGLLCDSNGLLVGLLVFKGNASEQPSLKEQIINVFGIQKAKQIVLCTDAGLCSVSNKMLANRQFKGYIMAQPLTYKKVPEKIRDWAVDGNFEYKGQKYTINEILDEYKKALENKNDDEIRCLKNRVYSKSRWYITKVKIYSDGHEKLDSLIEATAKDKENKSIDRLKEKDIAVPEKKGKRTTSSQVEFAQRFVVTFCLKYYLKQLEDLENDIEKAQNAISTKKDISKRSSNDFTRLLERHAITSEGEVIEETATSLLTERIEYERSVLGIYCQATNLSDSPETLFFSSRGRWIIEDIFRENKTALGIRRVYLHTEKHIIGHFEMVFLANTVLRTLIYKLYNTLKMDCQIGKMDKQNEDYFSFDNICEELRKLKGFIQEDTNEVKCVNTLRAKNALNTLMAKTFKYSLTMSTRTLDEFMKFVK